MSGVVRNKTASASAGSANTLTSAALNILTGSTIVVFCQSDGGINTPTDNAGNTYTARGSLITNSGINSRVYTCENATGNAALQVTFTTTFSANLSMIVGEADGVLAASFDQCVSALDSASPYTVTSGTLAQADSLALSFLSGNSATTPATHAESTGFTKEAEVTTGGPDWPCVMFSLVTSATTALTPSMTENGSSTGGAHILILKASPTFTLEQEGFRWGEDDGNEAAHTFTAAQDTSITAAAGSKLLRLLINATLDPTAFAYTLYGQKNGAGGYVRVPVGSTSSPTLSFGAAGTIAYSAASGTSVAPTYPSGITSNSCLVLVVGQKPTTANGGTVTTPSGWTLRASRTGANDGDTGGYTTTLGADTGNCNIFVYTKDTVSGSESGTLSVTVGDNNVCWANIYRVEASDLATFSFDAGTGKDTSAGNVSIATGSMAVAAGDWILAGMVIPTDVTTPAQFSSEALSQSGTTFGTVNEVEEPDSTTGNDIGGFICQAGVSSGSGSGAVTLTATAGGTTTNVRGPGFVLRIRATAVNNEAYISTSANIAAGGEATTARLTAPSGKSTSDFVTGRRWDDENGTDTIDITTDDYTEVEWRLTLAGSLSNGDYFDFRVYKGSTALNTYTVTPRWTVGGTVTGDLAATESADVAAIAGDVLVEGSLVVTETADAANIAGDVLVRGSFDVTESADVAAIAGDVLVDGSLIVTESADVAAIAGDVPVEGSFDVTESADATNISGTVGNGIVGDVDATESADVAAIAGDVLVHGSFDVVESADVANIAGDVLVDGSLAATESADATNIAGDVLVRGSLTAAESADVAAIAGDVPIDGSFDVVEPSDFTTISGVRVTVGDLVATEDADVAAIAGDVLVRGSLAAAESADVAEIAGAVAVHGSLAAVETSDTGNFAGDVLVEGNLDVTEPPDVVNIQQAPAIAGSLAALESADVAAIAGVLVACNDIDFHPKSPDIENLIAVAFLDKYGRFAKDERFTYAIRLFYGSTYCQPYADLTLSQFKALPRATRLAIEQAPSAVGIVDTQGISNA